MCVLISFTHGSPFFSCPTMIYLPAASSSIGWFSRAALLFAIVFICCASAVPEGRLLLCDACLSVRLPDAGGGSDGSTTTDRLHVLLAVEVCDGLVAEQGGQVCHAGSLCEESHLFVCAKTRPISLLCL